MLHTAVENSVQSGALVSRENYRPFPKYNDRTAWEGVNAEVRGYYAGFARSFNPDELIVPLPATRFMDFLRDGNRSRFEKLYFGRRTSLFALTMAECMEGAGNHIDDIINGVWAICEETSWPIPACNNGFLRPGEAPRILPDIEAPIYIDLFAAETASLLSWIYYLLGDEIALRAPQAKRRIELEMKRRILDPFLEHNGYWWLGFSSENHVNNWNPWINSNILTAFLIMEPDDERRRAGVIRSALSLQRFIDSYMPDGGCDEGPTYFGVAGASLFDYLEEISIATNGAVNLYGQQLIRNMAAYIVKVHIAGRYFVNFADAPARASTCTGLLERVGKFVDDPDLTDFARYMTSTGNANPPYEGAYNTLFRLTCNIFAYSPIENARYVAPRDHFFEGIQVLTARQTANSDEGIFLAVKGGHNAESHNHNDIGNFILYFDGKPVVIDAGVETYTKFTFNERRYSIWTMRSEYHNVPDINGCLQHQGRGYAAKDVEYRVEGPDTEISMDICGAYPSEAHVTRYSRTVRFARNNRKVTVVDEFELSQAVSPITHNLLCYDEPKPVSPGQISLGSLTLAFDPEVFDIAIETVHLADEKIASDWGKTELYRLRFIAKESALAGGFSFEFAAAEG